MFVVTLQDVGPDGSITDLTAGGQLGSARSIDSARSWSDGQCGYVLPYHQQTKATASPVPTGKVVPYDIEIRPAFSTIRKGHSLRLLIGTGDTPHLLPPPTKLLQMAGGIYQIQNNSVTPSWLTLPVSN
jgi:predicted acyl esterase